MAFAGLIGVEVNPFRYIYTSEVKGVESSPTKSLLNV